jgi:hypothetical protein
VIDFWLHGNYDTVTPGVVWNPSIATQVLPELVTPT